MNQPIPGQLTAPIDYDALLAKVNVSLRKDEMDDSATMLVVEMAAAIRALRAALHDAETGELKNALAVGQACIELQEERSANEALRSALQTIVRNDPCKQSSAGDVARAVLAKAGR